MTRYIQCMKLNAQCYLISLFGRSRTACSQFFRSLVLVSEPVKEFNVEVHDEHNKLYLKWADRPGRLIC